MVNGAPPFKETTKRTPTIKWSEGISVVPRLKTSEVFEKNQIIVEKQIRSKGF